MLTAGAEEEAEGAVKDAGVEEEAVVGVHL